MCNSLGMDKWQDKKAMCSLGPSLLSMKTHASNTKKELPDKIEKVNNVSAHQ